MNPILQFLLGDGFGKIIDKIFPDPAQKAQAQLEMLKLQQDATFKESADQLTRDLAQIDLNKVEAQSPSFWKSGARPAVLWVCVFSLVYQFLAQPLLAWGSGFWHVTTPPQLDGNTLLTILGALLGISTQRSVERVAGKS